MTYTTATYAATIMAGYIAGCIGSFENLQGNVINTSGNQVDVESLKGDGKYIGKFSYTKVHTFVHESVHFRTRKCIQYTNYIYVHEHEYIVQQEIIAHFQYMILFEAFSKGGSRGGGGPWGPDPFFFNRTPSLSLRLDTNTVQHILYD